MPYPRQLILPINNQDGPSLTGTAALVDGTPLPAQEIPAHWLQNSGRIFTKVTGRYTSSGTPGTVTLGLYLAKAGVAIGSALQLAVSAAMTVQTSLTNKSWHAEFETQILSPGAGGASFGQARTFGWCTGIIAGNLVTLIPDTVPMAAVSLDTTANERILVGLNPSVTTGTWVIHSCFSEYSGN